MLMLRSLRNLPSLRSFATSSVASRTLTRQDVDFIVDPQDPKYMDGFRKYAIPHRFAFKENDIAMWQNTFGDNYTLSFMCLKGTNQVISTMSTVTFPPLDDSNKTAYFIGLGWVDPEFRKKRVAALLGEMSLEMLPSADSHLISLINKHSRKFWHLLCEKEEVPDRGTDSLVSHYITFYKWDEFKNPKDLNLEFDDITVKSARDVPKVDMISYDQKIYPYHRERYMISHMHDKEGFGKVAYEDGKVVGMAQAVIYPKGDCNLGPVYGDNPRVVQAMFAEILKDINSSGKAVTRFIVISPQMCSDGFRWIAPFLNCKPYRDHYCNFVYRNAAPKNIDYSKVYSPTHAQLCPV